jgi:hypothetical protein
MSSAGQFNTPVQILPQHLKWEEDLGMGILLFVMMAT